MLHFPLYPIGLEEILAESFGGCDINYMNNTYNWSVGYGKFSFSNCSVPNVSHIWMMYYTQ